MAASDVDTGYQEEEENDDDDGDDAGGGAGGGKGDGVGGEGGDKVLTANSDEEEGESVEVSTSLFHADGITTESSETAVSLICCKAHDKYGTSSGVMVLWHYYYGVVMVKYKNIKVE